jgi:threonine dehydrogenase-like Zn-dependent dehydrogenase
MGAPEVVQLEPLADAFAEALARARPASVAILGIAGGNGLERIEPDITRRIVGIDINPSYLEAVRARFPDLPGLELHCLDLSAPGGLPEPVSLVHAALVFEHAGVEACLDNAIAMVAAGGFLSVVLQLPSEQPVSPTGVVSMRQLKERFAHVDPGGFRAGVKARGFQLGNEKSIALPGGKSFWFAIFARS